MTSKTVSLDIPSFYERSLDADRAPLAVLRAALVVGEQIAEHRSRCGTRHESLRETAGLLRYKIQEVLCFLDAFEHAASRPAKNDDDIAF